MNINVEIDIPVLRNVRTKDVSEIAFMKPTFHMRSTNVGRTHATISAHFVTGNVFSLIICIIK